MDVFPDEPLLAFVSLSLRISKAETISYAEKTKALKKKKNPRITSLFSSEWDLDIISFRRNLWGFNCVNMQGAGFTCPSDFPCSHGYGFLYVWRMNRRTWSVLPQLCQASFVLPSLRCSAVLRHRKWPFSYSVTEQHTRSSPTATQQGWFGHYCSCGGDTPSLNVKTRQMGNFIWPTGASMTTSKLPLLF